MHRTFSLTRWFTVDREINHRSLEMPLFMTGHSLKNNKPIRMCSELCITRHAF